MYQSELLHLIIAVISGYLFVVFAWWWIKKGNATTIYGITCFLMLGIFSTHLGAWYLYYEKVNGEPIADHLMTWYWPLRQYFMLFPLSFYVVHVTKKILKERKSNGINSTIGRNGDAR